MIKEKQNRSTLYFSSLFYSQSFEEDHVICLISLARYKMAAVNLYSVWLSLCHWRSHGGRPLRGEAAPIRTGE